MFFMHCEIYAHANASMRLTRGKDKFVPRKKIKDYQTARGKIDFLTSALFSTQLLAISSGIYFLMGCYKAMCLTDTRENLLRKFNHNFITLLCLQIGKRSMSAFVGWLSNLLIQMHCP